ncbi:hypothetical protein [Streptomyces griseorubiginosus]|uniref:hypothetical protein n=1 Tax=Streptomyces griseorubiginosus TaxID=67304 RepID=UPI001AD767EA|nr:hypothetical protein [Streptomyces griseorubiginosus]MBO4256676.1 hypothetical protein [Streptomyces griseorubiginosus]
MIPAMPAATATRQASVTALRFGRLAAMGTIAVLILIAGVWASWRTAPYVMLTKGREHGTVAVTTCGEDTCTGSYTPAAQGAPARRHVVIDRSVAVKKGHRYAVVVLPGSDEVVRSGPGGVLYAWVPLGGALLLASVVVAGGLRRTRAAWLLAVSGIALLTAAFMTV